MKTIHALLSIYILSSFASPLHYSSYRAAAMRTYPRIIAKLVATPKLQQKIAPQELCSAWRTAMIATFKNSLESEVLADVILEMLLSHDTPTLCDFNTWKTLDLSDVCFRIGSRAERQISSVGSYNWSNQNRLRHGAELLSRALSTLDSIWPYPERGYFIKGGVLSLSPALFPHYGDSALPLCHPPVPWTHRSSCFASSGEFLVRNMHDSPRRSILMRARATGQLDRTLMGLDVLGKVPWSINSAVLRTALRHHAHRRTGNAIDLQLKLAKTMNGTTFYHPHTIDFRGRAYTISPHLSPYGSDTVRGLLYFATRKPLGSSGLKWLCIHLANMAGADRLSFADREMFVQQHLADIIDSADRPISGTGWWRGTVRPWQVLAACKEVAAALRSPNSSTFESGLPVQQDGTCNGMQHFVALARDDSGAAIVNMQACEHQPCDLYSCVAELVARAIEQDISMKNGNASLAAALQGRITRSFVKRTIIASVYGISRNGASKQLQRKLEENNIVPKEMLHATATYLTKAIFRSLDSIFLKSLSVQKWLTAAAREVSHSAESADVESMHQTLLDWHTPLGLPVVPPYRKPRNEVATTCFGDLKVPKEALPYVDSNKQTVSFASNFVQSLDASHLCLTAAACDKQNITMASVHDSFWTHPCDVDSMNAILRAQFVALHQQPLLEHLRSELTSKYGCNAVAMRNSNASVTWRNFLLPQLPKFGIYNVSSVVSSDYFFS